MEYSSLAKASLQVNKACIRNNFANGGLLAAYFVVRLFLSRFHLNQTAIPSSVVVASTMIMFFIIGILLLINIRFLSAYNFDFSSVVIFFLFGTLLRTRKIDTDISLVLEILFLLLAVLLFIFFISRKPKLEKRTIFNKWFFIAIFLGFLYAFAITSLSPGKLRPTRTIDLLPALGYFAYYVSYGIGTGGILEEPIYRGFVFGFLRDLGLNNFQVVLAQGFFFWVSHFNLVNSPFSFWLALPVMSLLLGFLAYKSRSIVPPMIAHVIYNAYEVVYSQL